MKNYPARHRLSLFVSAILCTGCLAQAQAPAPAAQASTPAAPPRRPLYDPQQFPSERGQVQQFTLTGRGDIDGFILNDGTEVKTSPGLSQQLAFSIKPGDHVTIHGLRAAALPLVRAVSVTDTDSRTTVSDSDDAAGAGPLARVPPPAPRLPPVNGPGQPALQEYSGRVRMPLHGPQGEVNGVLLDSGAILRFPPNPAEGVSVLLKPRQPLVAMGVGMTNVLGTVVEVRQLGTTRKQLMPMAPTPPPGAEPRRRGPPAPPGAPPPA